MLLTVWLIMNKIGVLNIFTLTIFWRLRGNIPLSNHKDNINYLSWTTIEWG
jgi:hypothetical protein